MIWDYIRDFLVQYIFGGTDSNWETFSGALGYYDGDLYANTDVYFQVGTLSDGSAFSTTLGDWLSTTATIIIMALAVVLACLLVRWIWRVVSSAMLLK